MHHKKKRIWIRPHDRRVGICGKTHVHGHVREFDTKGQVLRKEKRRSKQARAVDESIRAESTRPLSSKKHTDQWQKDPGSTDIAGVDS